MLSSAPGRSTCAAIAPSACELWLGPRICSICSESARPLGALESYHPSTERRPALRNYSAARGCDLGKKEMRSLAGSAFLLVVLLPAPLGASPPSAATPFAARALASGQSHLDALKARCAPSSSCLAQ